MKRTIFCLLATLLTACSGLQPYKAQSLDYLKNIEASPADYQGKIVSFGGEVKGLTEDTHILRLVLKTDVPFYYYATGRGNSLSYELLLVDYAKSQPTMSGIQKGYDVKILARVTSYEKHTNMLGNPIGVLRLTAIAVADRTQKKDFFHEVSPDKELYDSWQQGRLFYEETPEQISALYPAPMPTQTAVKPQPAKPIEPKNIPAAPEIVYDEEEEFVL